jgi:hypothetical protein
LPPSAGGQGLTPELATNLRAKAAFGNAASLQLPQQKPKAPPAPPPDLALVSGTIANLSMPGSASGATAPTGGKIGGWRAQVAGEVTHQVEHPESVVTHAPSNVTLQAPTRRLPIDQYAVVPPPAPSLPPAAYAPRAPIVAPNPLAPPGTLGVDRPVVASKTLLGQRLAPAAVMPQSGDTLPALVTNGTAALPASALPLLPVEDLSQPASPAEPAAVMATPSGTGESTAAQVASAPERPSRYGPRASILNAAAPPSVLNYAATAPAPLSTLQSDASSAGIRPSRYFAGAALATQQFASLNRNNPPGLQQSGPPPYAQSGTGQPVAGQPVYLQSNGPRPVAAVAPVGEPDAAVSVLGPNGVPVLPPVPRPAGLPPITAEQALAGASAPATETALLTGTKPLDLAPSLPAPPIAAQPLPPSHRQRPRLTPPFATGN